MRQSGVLLHITSLPSEGMFGTLGKEAYKFVDWLKKAGMSIWQVLPVGPTGYGESPYQSVSTYAGNPLLIDLKTLEKEGYLEAGSYTLLPDSDQVDFEAVRREKEKALLVSQHLDCFIPMNRDGELVGFIILSDKNGKLSSSTLNLRFLQQVFKVDKML